MQIQDINKIGVLGAGVMGEALLKAQFKQGIT